MTCEPKRNGVFLLLTAMIVLGACAGAQTFTTGQQLLAQGRVEEGLKTLQQAVNEHPKNQEYRQYYFRQREIVLNQLLSQADDARLAGDLESAERVYRRVLGIEGSHIRALAGIERVQQERRHRLQVAEAEALWKKGSVESARAMVRDVLAENPNNRDARTLYRLIEEQRVRALVARPVLKPPLSKPVSLEFRDANIRSIFEAISRVAGVNFVFDKDVRPDLRATLFVRDTTISDVIKTLLVTNQLEQKVVNENTIVIYPNTPAKARDYQELVVKSFYLTNADAKQALNLVRSILRTRDVYIDEKLNMLVMRDTAEAIRVAEKLIANHDLADPEVVLEVEITEIKRSRLTDLGILYPNTFSVLNLATTNTVTTSAGIVVANTPVVSTNPLTLETLRNLSAAKIAISPVEAHARSEHSDVNLLANPRIRVKNREKARIHIGDRVPVITSTALANIGVTESVNYLDVGLRLEVEPAVNLDDEVSIRVGLEVSNIVREIKSSTGTLTYQIGTRSAVTMLRLKDGETQALAGLINDEDRKSASKVPGLGSLPVVGRLFSTERNDASKTEIILLITPRIVRNVARPEAAATEFAAGTEASTSAAAFGTRLPDGPFAAPAPPPSVAPPPGFQPGPAPPPGSAPSLQPFMPAPAPQQPLLSPRP